MSNEFKEPIHISNILEKLDIKFDEQWDFNVSSICDSDSPVAYSVCDYVKGRLPDILPGLVLFTKENIEDHNCIVVENPQELIAKLIGIISSSIGFKQLYITSGVHKSVIIGQNVVIEDNVCIGENTIVEHNAVIHSGTKIGKNCIIRSNSTIGCQGYSFYKNSNDNLCNFPSLGGVVLKNNVEVGYGCCIVKGTINNTVLENYVKLDNLIHIAHDCHIDVGATITAGVTFCGYVSVGKNTRIAPQSTIMQRLTIGDNVLIGLGSVVRKDVKNDSVVAGNPAKLLKIKVKD